MGRGIGDLVNVFVQFLPPWALALIAVAAMAWLLPRWRVNARGRQVKEALRRVVRADPPRRADLVERAFERAGNTPWLLETIVQEARKRALPAVEQRALEALDTLPDGRSTARRLRAEVSRPASDPMHPTEAVLRVEALLAEGVGEAARARLDEALAQHPDHAELLALRERIDPPHTAKEAADPLDAASPRR